MTDYCPLTGEKCTEECMWNTETRNTKSMYHQKCELILSLRKIADALEKIEEAEG